MNSRRRFLAQSSAIALGSIALQSFTTKNASLVSIAKSDQINIGAIGINGMGWADAMSMLKNPGVNLVALCDVDKNVLDKRMAELKKANIDTSKIKIYGDYRSLLNQKDVDAVIIGTPDHWHTLQMIHAVQAGKDVYVEKPAGQWQRSQQHFRDAVEFIRSGQLGNIRTVKVWCYQGWMKPDIVRPDTAPPPGVDYKAWLGPSKIKPFNASRFHFNFRWFWDYAGGLMTDWGVHLMDYAVFGMGASIPKTVSALGGKFAYPDLAQETPDTLAAIYEFDKFNLIWDHALGIDNGLFEKDHGIAFIGNNGTLELDRGGWEVFEEKGAKNKVSVLRNKPVDNGLDKHTQNFINVVRSRKLNELNCPIQTGAHIATVCQMGNIAYRCKEKITWDKTQNRFTNEKLNKEYLSAKYHNGYMLPKIS